MPNTGVTFPCLPTPQTDDGSIDISIMTTAADQLGTTLAGTDGYHTVVVKSTVVPGATEATLTPVLESASDKTTGDACARPRLRNAS